MKKFVLFIVGALLVMFSSPIKAQESANDGYNPNSKMPTFVIE